jgi:RNA polymerase sigma-70 factor (ECF subfamily)
MPADIVEASGNQNNSSIANGSTSPITGETRCAGFATTHWSVVLTAQSESPEAHEALEKICRTYWRPLYGFVRAQGLGPQDAQDMVQEFFATLLRRQNFRTIRQEKGRLRSYLLVSLKRFLASERRRAKGVKCYQTTPSITLDELLASESADFHLAQKATPDQLYERGWILTLLDQVLARLETEYRSAGKEVLFYRVKDSLVGDAHGRLQAEIAAELGMTENAVNQAFHRFRQRYRVLLREEIAMTVAQPGEVEDELRHFASVLRR